MIKYISNPAGFLSNATIYDKTVYVSGQVAYNAAGGSITAQTEDIFNTIDAILAEAGTDKTQLLKADIWLTDIADASEFNVVWQKWLDGCPVPARACVESKFVKPDWHVEVAVIAALKG